MFELMENMFKRIQPCISLIITKKMQISLACITYPAILIACTVCFFTSYSQTVCSVGLLKIELNATSHTGSRHISVTGDVSSACFRYMQKETDISFVEMYRVKVMGLISLFFSC